MNQCEYVESLMMQYVVDAVLLVQQQVRGAYGSRYRYGYAPGNVKKYIHILMFLYGLFFAISLLARL